MELGTTDIPYEVYVCSIRAPAAYRAPEVFDRSYHRQSDVFSLGLVFVMIVESSAGELIPYAKYAEIVIRWENFYMTVLVLEVAWQLIYYKLPLPMLLPLSFACSTEC